MEMVRRRGRRRKKLLDDLKDRRGYCHLKEQALYRTMWRHRFGGGFGPVVRQNTEWMKEWWREELSETCRVSGQNKFVKLVHLFGFIIKKFVMMHGHASRCTVTCQDARSRVTMHGHVSRCTVTCQDARSRVTMHGHMSRCTVTGT